MHTRKDLGHKVSFGGEQWCSTGLSSISCTVQYILWFMLTKVTNYSSKPESFKNLKIKAIKKAIKVLMKTVAHAHCSWRSSPCSILAAVSARTQLPCAAQFWWWTRRRWWGRTRSCWLRGWTAQSEVRYTWSTAIGPQRHASYTYVTIREAKWWQGGVSPDSRRVWCQTALWNNERPEERRFSAWSLGNGAQASSYYPHWKTRGKLPCMTLV